MGGPAGRLATAPNKSGVLALRPGPSLAGLAALEPGSRDRPEDHSPVRSGGSHLPLRARRNVARGPQAPQRPYPRTAPDRPDSYPRDSGRVDDLWRTKAPSSIRDRTVGRRFVQGGDRGSTARATRGTQRWLGEAVRCVQPSMADGAVPADPTGQGPAQRPLAGPPAPCRLDRPPDRRSCSGASSSTSSVSRRPPTSSSSRRSCSMVAVGPVRPGRLQRHGRDGPHPRDPPRDADDDRPRGAHRVGGDPRRRPG